MSQIVETKEIASISEARSLLAEKIEETFGSSGKASLGAGISKISIEIEPSVSLLEWLSSSEAASKIYWSDRNGKFEMAGAGECFHLAADTYENVESVIARASHLVRSSFDGVRIFGGIRFPSSNSNGTESDWAPFESCRFMVPRFQIIKSERRAELVCNIRESDTANVQEIIRELNDNFSLENSTENKILEIVSRNDQPTFDDWESIISSVIRDFSKGRIEKIVLARQTTITFKDKCDALGLLARLSGATPRCYHYFFQPQNDLAFLGASPERLYFRQSRMIESEALAGTRPRGESGEMDLKLGEELLQNEKELREHKYVVDNIKAALSALCENYCVEKEAALLKLARLQHLQTEFKGKLHSHISEQDIIHLLHPTSAVGGFPSSAAQLRIAECEPFDRGWYAGAVGWLAKDSAEFAVAIRSGLVKNKELKLFSGAGIIQGSTAQAEWDEIENKIGSFISAVTG